MTGVTLLSANEMAQVRTDLALDRTLMAADRSLMAWIRTALSMISFGFTIYKLLQTFEQQGGQLGQATSPRTLGLFLIALGTTSMLMGLGEYWFRLKGLRAYGTFRMVQPAFVIAVVMSFTGVSLLLGIMSRTV